MKVTKVESFKTEIQPDELIWILQQAGYNIPHDALFSTQYIQGVGTGIADCKLYNGPLVVTWQKQTDEEHS